MLNSIEIISVITLKMDENKIELQLDIFGISLKQTIDRIARYINIRFKMYGITLNLTK